MRRVCLGLGLALALASCSPRAPKALPSEPLAPPAARTDAGVMLPRFVRVRVESEANIVEAQFENGAWTLATPIRVLADTAALERIWGALSLAKLQPVAGSPPPDKELGLDPPRFRISAWPQEGEPWTLEVGVEDAFDGSVWVRRGPSDTRRYRLAGGQAQALSPTLFVLRDRRLVPLETLNVQRVEVDSPRGAYWFSRIGLTDWHVGRPEKIAHDARMCEWAVRGIVQQRFLSLQEPIHFTPVLRLRFFDANGRVGELSLGAEDDQKVSWARWDGRNGEVRFGRFHANILWPWVEGVAPFRDRRLLRFESGQVARLELQAAPGGTQRFARQKDGTFRSGNRTVPTTDVDGLLLLLDGLRASSFRAFSTETKTPWGVALWDANGKSLGRLTFGEPLSEDLTRVPGRLAGVSDSVELEASRMSAVRAAMLPLMQR